MGTNSRDRFVRMSWYYGHLRDADHARKFHDKDPEPKNLKTPDELIADLRTVGLSVAVPQGAPDVDQWEPLSNESDPQSYGVYPTWWYTAYDFPRKRYYWQFYRNPNGYFVDLNQLAKHNDVLQLDATNPGLHGDATKYFEPVSP